MRPTRRVPIARRAVVAQAWYMAAVADCAEVWSTR